MSDKILDTGMQLRPIINEQFCFCDKCVLALQSQTNQKLMTKLFCREHPEENVISQTVTPMS